jgi:hypothetical protein
MQAHCLLACLRHHDNQATVVFRGDQRYVPRVQASAVAKVEPSRSWSDSDLKLLGHAERRTHLEEYLREEFMAIAGLALSREDMERPLQTLGLDSLMAIQFRNRLEARLGIVFAVVDFLKGLSLNQLVDNALHQLAAAGPSRMPEAPTPGAAVAYDDLDHLSERELDRLLQTLLVQQ